jgi:hypothetical protein
MEKPMAAVADCPKNFRLETEPSEKLPDRSVFFTEPPGQRATDVKSICLRLPVVKICVRGFNLIAVPDHSSEGEVTRKGQFSVDPSTAPRSEAAVRRTPVWNLIEKTIHLSKASKEKWNLIEQHESSN